MPPNDRARRLTARLARGLPIDWDREVRAAKTSEERGVIEQLRLLAAMDEMHRGLHSAASVVEGDAALAQSLASAQEIAKGGADRSAVPNPSPRMGILGPGARWGPLEILESIGTGAFGEVYRARDTRLDREVALKLLKREATPSGDETIAEARLLARARHPHVALVYGAERIEGRVGIWMELLQGQTLDRILAERGMFEAREAALVGIDLCRALAAVHAAGITHRDVKLSNVMRAAGGRIVLMDFGLGDEETPRSRPGGGALLLGTPLFMAPEVLNGGTADRRSDLYSLGVVLFALVTGTLPLEAPTIAELRAKHARGEARPARDLRPDLSADFAEVLQRLLAPDRTARFASAGQAEQALLRVLTTSRPPASEDPTRQRRTTTPHRLPEERDLFVGRQDLLADLEERAISRSRLITLLGAGGMGKTRLAVHHGWRSLPQWPGGVWFCDLTEARDRPGIAGSVATALRIPLAVAEDVQQIGHALAARGRCLLILDNFEQVADHAGETIGPWLERCPDLHLLVTSRIRLKVAGEDLVPVEPLSAEAGLQLFCERARSHRPQFTPGDSELAAIRDLIGVLEGIPLAIELAAARIRVMTPAQLVARQRSRLQLVGGKGAGRHATLRAAISGSWELLEPWERAALTQCSLFEGGFTLEAAEGILDLSAWAAAPWIVDVLQSLVDQSLLRTWTIETPMSESAPGLRFGMFVPIQEYAREQFAHDDASAPDQSGADALRVGFERHGRWFAQFGTDEAVTGLDRHGGLERRRALAHELDNLSAACLRAIQRSDGEIATATFRAIAAVLDLRGPFSRTIELGTQVLTLDLADGARARVLLDLCQAGLKVGRRDRARDWSKEAVELYRRAGDRAGEGVALARLGSLPVNFNQLDESHRELETAVQIHREVGDRLSEGIVLGNYGLYRYARGAFDEASQVLETAIEIHREVGNLRSEGVVTGNLGALRMDQGRFEEAQALLERALALHRRVGNRRYEGIALNNLGRLSAHRNEYDAARACFEEALAIQRELGAREFEARSLDVLGDLAFSQARMEEAIAHYRAALAISREIQNVRAQGILLGRLARAELALGRRNQARDTLSEGETILRAADQPQELAQLLVTRAELALQEHDADAARRARDDARRLTADAKPSPDLEPRLAALERALDAGDRG